MEHPFIILGKDLEGETDESILMKLLEEWRAAPKDDEDSDSFDVSDSSDSEEESHIDREIDKELTAILGDDKSEEGSDNNTSETPSTPEKSTDKTAKESRDSKDDKEHEKKGKSSSSSKKKPHRNASKKTERPKTIPRTLQRRLQVAKERQVDAVLLT